LDKYALKREEGMSSTDIVTLSVGLLSLSISAIAIFISITNSRAERSSSSWWEIYREFQREEVKKGRLLAQKILTDTHRIGFKDRKDYVQYFKQVRPDDNEHIFDKQYLHDLAAFYNLVGVLIQKRELNKDFILLLIGQGLEDRWPVFNAFADFYPNVEISYVGMYWLYSEYIIWKKSTYLQHIKKFKSYREIINEGSN
jgi:hypothetical protein